MIGEGETMSEIGEIECGWAILTAADDIDQWVPQTNHSEFARFQEAVFQALVVGATLSSLPVNIPDWSKILRDEYRDNNRYKEKKEGTGEREEKRKSEERGERKENKKL